LLQKREGGGRIKGKGPGSSKQGRTLRLGPKEKIHREVPRGRALKKRKGLRERLGAVARTPRKKKARVALESMARDYYGRLCGREEAAMRLGKWGKGKTESQHSGLGGARANATGEARKKEQNR